jgi:isochorismate synthase
MLQQGQPMDSARSFLLECLARGVPEGRVVHITLPAPRADLESFLEQVPRKMGTVWYPKTGTAFAGVGVAARFDVKGPERLEELRRAVDDLWQRSDSLAHPAVAARMPRVFGGLSFGAGDNDEPPWTEFSDGCFTLPRWVYGREGDEVFLMLSLVGRDLENGWEAAIMTEYDRLSRILEMASASETFVGLRRMVNLPASAVQGLSTSEWTQLIDGIKGAIAGGTCDKIVAARRSVVSAPRPLDDVTVLSRLAVEYRGCYRFAFRRDTATFLGASPERLFLKQGSRIETQALAGTIAADGKRAGKGNARTLMGSQKDRLEHAIVVDEITARLRPLCVVLDHAEKPEIREVRNLLHLNTPIAGRLRRDVHPVAVLDALHPTPAVAGLPRKAAMAWIRSREAYSRGWYTGPVGWISADGDAEFVVAIRCGLIAGAQAFIYAGAGIVAASDADAEYRETAAKQVPLLRSLGVQL